MMALTMDRSRMGKCPWLHCGVLIVFSFSMLSCYETETSESVPSAPSQNLARGSSVTESLSQENALEGSSPSSPAPVAFPERESFKREGAELWERELYRLAEINYDDGLLIRSSADSESLPRGIVEVHQVLIEAKQSSEAGQTARFVDGRSETTRVRRFERSSREQLRSMEGLYRAALRNLFGNPYRNQGQGSSSLGDSFNDSVFDDDSFGDHNPFEEALASNDLGQGETRDAQTNTPASPQAAVADPKPPQIPVSGGALKLLEDIEELPEGSFNFLLTGDFSADDEQKVFRAVRDDLGRFVLENYKRFTLTSGVLIFKEGERLLTTDLNGDGAVDLVVLREGSSSKTESLKLSPKLELP